MSDKYFDKFPIVTYANTQAIDITKRVALLESESRNPYLFYPYEISSNERPDQLSNRYYQDSYKSWTVYLANKVLDPYYEWYLHDNEFNQFIVDKYGSLEIAQEKISHYRNNWYNSEKLDISGYNALTAKLKAYWEPEHNSAGNIISYKRKEKNWSINTNKIVSYTVSNTSFINNEICDIVFNVNNVGRGQILNTANNTIFVQHLSGVFLSNSSVTITGSSHIVGSESAVNTVFTVSTLKSENLEDEEEVYWIPITYFDLENEKNEYNKSIRLIDNRYINTVVKNFKELMRR